MAIQWIAILLPNIILARISFYFPSYYKLIIKFAFDLSQEQSNDAPKS
jgi:hypothetical protein